MKTLLLSFLFLTCMLFFGISQEKVLVLRNISTGKERVIREGKRIKIRLMNGEELSGRLNFRIDSDDPENLNLLVSDHLVPIGDIRVFQTQSLFAQISGGTVTGVGGLTGFLGYLILEGSSYDNEPVVSVIGLVGLTGGILLGFGGLGLMNLGRKYHTTHWNLQVKTLPPGLGYQVPEFFSKVDSFCFQGSSLP